MRPLCGKFLLTMRWKQSALIHSTLRVVTGCIALTVGGYAKVRPGDVRFCLADIAHPARGIECAIAFA